MKYALLAFQTPPALTEILEAELSTLGYGAFWEDEGALHTAIAEPLFDEAAIQSLIEQYRPLGTITYTKKIEAKQNWNARWEASFQPIAVDGTCRVRAHFHAPDTRFPLEIVITPKMSFGTGHHETTRLMMRQQLRLRNRFNTVLDLGTGTGILAILAKKLGAETVWGFDIEPWAVENATENAKVNRVEIETRLGTITEVEQLDISFDLVLANINRSVLEREIPRYTALLNAGGTLLLSGFYERDIHRMLAHCHGLREEDRDREDRWACLRLVKK